MLKVDLIARLWCLDNTSSAKRGFYSKSAAILASCLSLVMLGTASWAYAEANPDSASDTSSPSLNLAEAKHLAFVRNWDLLAAKSDVDLATAQRLVAREFPNPVASFSVQKISIDNHSAGTSEGNGFWERNYDTIAAVNQLIEIGGKRRARKDSAAAGLRSAEARLADTRRTLDAGVTQAYVTVLLAEEKRQILTDSAASLRKEAGIAEARQHAGEISLADKSQIEIAAERLELDATTAEADARNAIFMSCELSGADFQGDADVEAVRHADFDGANGFLESRRGDFHLVVTGRQSRCHINALGICGEIRLGSHRNIRDHDFGSGDHGTARVGNPAGDGAFCVL